MGGNMLLINKKTGEIVELGEDVCINTLVCGRIEVEQIMGNGKKRAYYDSLGEFNKDWEDYAAEEPLIKDKKIRKVVRAWAKINTFEPGYSVMYDADIFGLTSYQADIEFNFPLKELIGGKYYTIKELCGEEKSRPVIVNDIKYSSYEDYIKSRKEKK